MPEATTSHSGGIGFIGVLAIVFLVLKLTHVIDWSWWWVSSPLWIPWALGIGSLAMLGVASLIVKVWDCRH